MVLPLSQLLEWSGPMAGQYAIVNKFMRLIEGVAEKGTVESRTLGAEPAVVADGARYLLPVGATGTHWLGHDGQFATAIGNNASNGWHFMEVARPGFELFVKDEAIKLIYLADTHWTPVATGEVDAGEVSFTPSAEGSYVATVEQALDELYARDAHYFPYLPIAGEAGANIYSETVGGAIDELLAMINALVSTVGSLQSGGAGTGRLTLDGAKVRKASALTGQNVTAGANVAWTADDWDTGGYHDLVTNNDRITVTNPGYYEATGNLRLDNVTGGNQVSAEIQRYNSSNVFQEVIARENFSSPGTSPAGNMSGWANFAAGDYIVMVVLVGSDTSVDFPTTASMQLQRIA